MTMAKLYCRHLVMLAVKGAPSKNQKPNVLKPPAGGIVYYHYLFALMISLSVVLGSAEQSVAQQSNASVSLVITNVTVIDVEKGARSPNQTIVVSGNRITSVGPAANVNISTGSRVIDGRGKFVIPGLWDMHVHALHNEVPRTLPFLVANGVTGIRDMGSTFDQVAEARKAIVDGTLVAPRVIASGPALDGIPVREGLHGIILEIKTPEEGRRVVDQLAAARADLVKIHTGLSRETYHAIVEESKRWLLPFAGHLPPDVDIVEASDAGQQSVEHIAGLAAACAADPAALRRPDSNTPPQSEPIEINLAKCQETARHLARNGTWLVPTIGGPGLGNPRTRQFNLKITEIAVQAGVRVLPGTDWPGFNFQSVNRSTHDELAGFVEAGLSPAEALRTATLNTAIFLNMSEQVGTITPGKLADLLLLDGDPLVDIKNTKRIAAVVANGRLIDSELRKKLLDAEAARQANSKP
jgi:imidazolonepropionase-like amidohydrolase